VSHYDKDRDNAALGKWYTDHVSAMTREGLHAKSDIAAELALESFSDHNNDRNAALRRCALRVAAMIGEGM